MQWRGIWRRAHQNLRAQFACLCLIVYTPMPQSVEVVQKNPFPSCDKACFDTRVIALLRVIILFSRGAGGGKLYTCLSASQQVFTMVSPSLSPSQKVCTLFSPKWRPFQTLLSPRGSGFICPRQLKCRTTRVWYVPNGVVFGLHFFQSQAEATRHFSPPQGTLAHPPTPEFFEAAAA